MNQNCLHLLKLLLTIVIACSFAPIVLAQRSKARPVNKNIRVLKNKPTVYITFERIGKRKPTYGGESNDRVWLRLHNNTRWSLVLDAKGIGGEAFSKASEKEVGLFYGVEEMSNLNVTMIIGKENWAGAERPRNSPLPTESEVQANLEEHKYDSCEVPSSHHCHVCSTIKLPPGKSLLFSLPRETLCENLKVYISYQYDWEDFVGEPEHRVYYYGSELMKELNKK